MNRMGMQIIAAVLGLALPGFLHAARPLATEDAGVVETDSFELETGLESLRRCGGGRERAMGFVLKTGLARRLDLGIEIPYYFEPVSGWDSSSLSVKYALLADSRVPASLYFSHCLGGSGYGLAGIMSVSLKRTSLHFNAGFETEGVAGGTTSFCYAGALEYPIFGSAFIVGEVVGLERELTGLLGARWNPAERMCLDLGLGFGIADTDSRELMTAGLTVVL